MKMKTGSKEYIDYVDNLCIFEKLKVYMDYAITMLAMKYDFHMVKKKSPLSSAHRYITEYTGEKRYLWLDTKVISFEDFISSKNWVIHYYPPDFEIKEKAGKPCISMHGIYDWYWKYKNKLDGI